MALGAELEPILKAVRSIRGRLDAPAALAARADILEQLDGLVYPGFLAATAEGAPGARIEHYLRSLLRRVEKLERGPAADAERLAQLRPLWLRLRQRADWRNPVDPGWNAWRWRVEELRISLFAQELGAAPVSVPRLRRELAELDAG
jgi:ATP-dependent helicase HrpA